MLKLPREIPSNYILNPEKSFFSIVVPEEGTNLFVNPEVYDLYGYSFTGEHDLVTEAHYGLNSIRANLDTTEEAYYSVAITLQANTTYTFSVSIKGVNEVDLRVFTASGTYAQNHHVTTDFWSRYSLTFTTGTTPLVNPKFSVMTKHKSYVYLSAWQLEAKPYMTTFISGNLAGFNPNERPIPYFWTGVPHRSPSTRTKFTRDGGKIINLVDMGIHVTGYEGFGLPDFDHQSITLVNRPGSLYRDSNLESRDVTILGVLYSRDFNKFFEQRSILTSTASPLLSNRPQPMKLLFQLFDCEAPKSEVIEMAVLYAGGLDGNFNSAFGETLSIDFVMFDPFMYRIGNKSEALCLVQSITNNGIVYRDKTGTWDTTPDFAGIVTALEVGADNNLYIGSGTSFSTNAAIVFRFDGITMTAIGSGGEEFDTVYAIEQGLDNKLYVGGSFNVMSGIGSPFPSKVQNLARYNLTNGLWEDFGNVFHSNPAVAAGVFGIEQMRDGRIAIVGRFDRADTPTTTTVACRNIIIYNPKTLSMETLDGSTLTGIGGGALAHKLSTVLEDRNGYLWVGGQFVETIGPHTCRNIARFRPKGDGTYEHYTILGVYIDNLERRAYRTSLVPFGFDCVNDLEMDAEGSVYAAGRFDATSYTNQIESTLPGTEFVASNPFFVAKFDNVAAWISLGLIATLNIPPATTDQTEVFDLELDPNSGGLYFAGYFNYAGPANYLLINNPSTIFAPTASRNPADHLTDYTQNTTCLAKTNGTILLPEPVFTLTTNVQPTMLEKIKIGGFYPAFSYTSTFSLPPTFLTGLSDAGYENTFYTNMKNKPVSLICTTEVEIAQSDIVFPVLTIIGPGELISLRNYDGGLAPINFNKTLLAGEILVIDWTSSVPRITSNLFGNQSNIIRPGSSLSTFKLLKGTNHVSLFMRSTTITTSTKAYITWRQAFISLDTAIAQ